MSHWDFGRQPAGRRDAAIPPPGGAEHADDLDDEGFDDEGFAPYPITYERGRIEPVPSRPAAAAYEPYEPWPSAPEPDPDGDDQWQDDHWQGDQWQGDQPWPPQPRQRPRRRGPRQGRGWLIAAGIAIAAAAIGGIAVLLTSGPGNVAATGIATRPTSAASATSAASPAPSAQAASRTTAPTAAGTSAAATATPPLPLPVAQAKAVLAGYTTANNRANAQRSDQRLATVETGSSYAIDAVKYLVQRAAGVAPYPAFGPASATYYIPRAEPAAGPRWFVVRVANAFASSPEKVSSVEYLLFLQATPGAPWRNAIEPYLLPGASAPRIAVGDDGLATAVAATATSLNVAPVQLAELTANSFDGSGPMAIPASVADRTDKQSWQEKAPALTITDRHAPATAGQAFALRTTDGGALVFYTVAATMTITEPAGSVFRLNIPGLQSPAQSLRRAVLQYRDQFAAYDPPAGSGTPRIIAGYSGITRKM